MDKIGKGPGLNPHRSLGEVTPPIELLSEDSSLRLPLGLEAPVMTPNSVNFLFYMYSSCCSTYTGDTLAAVLQFHCSLNSS